MWLAREVINNEGFFEDYLEITYKNYIIRVSKKSYNKKFMVNSPIIESKPGYEQLTLF